MADEAKMEKAESSSSNDSRNGMASAGLNMRTHFSAEDQEIVKDCCISRAIQTLMKAYDDCEGVTFAGVGLDALIAAWQAFEVSRTTAKENDPIFHALLNEAIKTQENGHELYLSTDQVGIWVEHIGLILTPSFALEAFNYYLDTWIHPHSPTSGGVPYHLLDFDMDGTRDYSIGLSFDDNGEIVFDPQMKWDGIVDLAKRVFFFMIATTEKLEAWKAASKGGKLAFTEICAIRRLFFFFEVPTKLQEMQHPQLLTLTKLQRASNKKKGVHLTAKDISNILETFGPIARPESKNSMSALLDEVVQKRPDFFTQLKLDDTRVENLFVKCSKHQLERTAIKLDVEEASDLLSIALATAEIRKITRIDHEKFPAHPQVTAFRKLERSSIDCNGTTLNFEELAGIGDIVFLPYGPYDRPDHNTQMSNGVLETKRQNASSWAPKMKKDSKVGNNLPSCSHGKAMKEIIEVLYSLVTYFPDIRDDHGIIMQQDVVKVLLIIATGIKAMHCAKDKDTRDILHLHKTVALKDKKLREAETDLIKARELKGAREEKFGQENGKLESELKNARHELEKARKEPDYVREQFSNKMQNLHDKIRALKNDVEQQSKAKNILELDNEAMTKDLESKRTKIERQKEQLKKFREEFIKVREERDQLRSRQPFNEPDAHAHVKKLESNIRELEEDNRSLNNAKATSDETIRELEEDLRNLNSAKATGEETIRELLQQQAEQKKEISNLEASLVTMEEIQTTTMDQLEKEREKGSISVNIDKKATILDLEKELADERSKLKLAEGRDVEFAVLQQELAVERAKSKRLEERLGPLLAAAVAAGSL